MKIVKYGHMLVVLFVTVISSLGTVLLNNNAVASGKFALSPMSQRVILVPGETYRSSITIANPNSAEEDFNYSVTVAPYSLGKNEVTDTDFGGSDFKTMTDYTQIVNWITLDNAKGTLAPNEQKTVSFSITVPKNAPAGGQYAVLLVGEDISSEETNGGMGITEIIQMAHTIYAEVAGETRTDGIILENKIPSFLLSDKLAASSVVKNNGNVHADAEYILQIWPIFSDEEIYTNEENIEKILIMPGSTKYHNQEVDLPSIGIFRVKQTVKIFGETSIVEKTVIVCPLWLLSIIIFVVIAGSMWIVIKIKMRKN